MSAIDIHARDKRVEPLPQSVRGSIVICHLDAADAMRLLMRQRSSGADIMPEANQGGILILHLAQLNRNMLAQLPQLKARAACLRCIVVMAEGSDDAQVIAFGAGADDVIVGPCSTTVLNARIVKQKLELERDLAAVACSRQLARRLEKMRALALHDPLTGLANRRALEQAFRREWACHLRHRRALGIIMIDVDHFKHYNDSRGHPQGDVALRRIGASLRETIKRETDVVARYGGEEFICLVSEVDAAQALALAEGIRAAVEGLALEHTTDMPTRVLSVSIGVTVATPAPGLAAEEAIARADRALYEAKRAGRNQVVLHNSIPPQPAVSIKTPGC